jgi:hypothetical protein
MNNPEPPKKEEAPPAPPVNATVAKSVARPDAFSKPGVEKAKAGKGVRFRALQYKRGPGRPRKHPRDRRDVQYW